MLWLERGVPILGDFISTSLSEWSNLVKSSLTLSGNVMSTAESTLLCWVGKAFPTWPLLSGAGFLAFLSATVYDILGEDARSRKLQVSGGMHQHGNLS